MPGQAMANRSCLFIERLDLALQLDQQRVALAVQRLAGGHLDPAFADAVLRDVQTLLVIESNTNVMFEHGSDVKGAALVNGQVVGQRGELSGFGHGYFFSVNADLLRFSMIWCCSRFLM